MMVVSRNSMPGLAVSRSSNGTCAGEDQGFNTVFVPHPLRNVQNPRPSFRQRLSLHINLRFALLCRVC